jgi:putative addiction module killer protein
MRRLPAELRIDTGPGYRVDFARVPINQCLILCGGSKRTQVADIERARKWLEEAGRRQNQ